MNAQSLQMKNSGFSPIHITGRHVLLVATLVVVTFSMLFCLCIFFAYNAPLIFITHIFASMDSLPTTSISALTFAITGGTAIILWTVLFLCAQKERAAQHTIALTSAYVPASNATHFSSVPTAPTAPATSTRQDTRELFFSQPATPVMLALQQKNQATWETNFAQEIEAKQNTIRQRQRSRELRLQTHGSTTRDDDQSYQMKRIGTRHFYKKAQQDYTLDQRHGPEQSPPFNEIYWWSTLPGTEEPILKSTEGITKLTHKMIREHTTS